MIKKLFGFIAELLFSSRPAARACRAAAAFAVALLLIFKPFTAARLLPYLLWAAFALVALHFADAARRSATNRRRNLIAAGVTVSAGILTALSVRGDRLALLSVGLWAAAAGIAALRPAFDGKLRVTDRGLFLAEGVLSLLIGGVFLLRLDRDYLDLASTPALYFFALAVLTLTAPAGRRKNA